MSQPVLSQALAKLRVHFDDALLIRQGNSYIRTPLGEALLPLVQDALSRVEIASEIKSTFDSATSNRTFVIAASDYAAATILSPLRRILSDEAPGVGIEVITASGRSAHRLDFANCDLVVGVTGYSIPGMSATLFTDDFVCLIDSKHEILNQDSIDIRQVASLPNASGYFGDQVATPVDRVFEDLGVRRHIAAQVSGYLSLPHLVENTDLVAFVPRLLAQKAQRSANLTILEMPNDARAHLVEVMYWPAARDTESASIWLRGVIKRACEEVFSTEETEILHLTNIPAALA
jgi:DNA-binding transcriptional LysR family regulator